MVLLLQVLMLYGTLCVESASSNLDNEFWLAAYGKVGHGRPLSDGVNIGEMSMIQCSVFCSTDETCQAVEFVGSKRSSGLCYKFTKLTHNGVMLPAPGHQYFEKRKCLDVCNVDAVVVFQDSERLFIFTGQKVIVFNIISEDGNVKLKSYGVGDITVLFPGLTSRPVQAAFLGVANESVYILAGGQLYYYLNKTPGKPLLFNQSTANDALTPFLTTNTGYVTAIVSVDPGRTRLHIMDGDTFYRLQWNAGTKKYDNTDSFSRTDPNSMWSGLPENITALSKSTDDTNFVALEDHKMYWYHTGQKTVSGIVYVCDVTPVD